MTEAEKVAAYERGDYRFAPPPVCTAFWDRAAWIKWIDACKGWTVAKV
jgi:hypothetical protein